MAHYCTLRVDLFVFQPSLFLLLLSMMQGKRFRTQMSNLQLKVMKNIFADYKTPTMAECEMLGKEIGLPKRVIQVQICKVFVVDDI